MRVKKILKILAYSLSGFVVFLLLLAALSQTQIFRNGLRSFLLSRASEALDAEIHLGTMTGNLISGFSIDQVSIKVGHDYFVTAERLDIRYDLFQIPGRTVAISDLALVKPDIAMLRGREGRWNFERMIRPAPGDTTHTGPFDWKINIKRLKIENATFVLIDSASLSSSDHEFDDTSYVEFHDIALKNLTLDASVYITNEEKHAVISTLRFDSDRPSFSLKHLAGDFTVTPAFARVKGLSIRTGASNIRLDAEMKNFDLLGGVDLEALQKKPVELSLHAHNIDLNELKRFISPIGFLNSSIGLDLETQGEFGELRIKRLDLTAGESEFHVTGTLFNLHTPSMLYLNTTFEKSFVTSTDAKTLLPTFHLPDLERLGRSALRLTFVGMPLDFRTRVSLTTDAGNVQVDGAMKIGGAERLRYSGTVGYNALNLAGIFNNPELHSKLYGSLRIDGKGTMLNALETSLDVQMDSSELAGRAIRGTHLRVEASGGKFTTTGDLTVGTMHAVVRGTFDNNPDPPAFSLRGTVNALNLEDLLHEQSALSDLNFSIAANGSGITWSSLNGDVLLDILPSRYREYKIDSSAIHLVVDQHNPANKRLTFTSNIADFSLTGAFNTDYMKELIQYEILNLRREIGLKFVAVDTAFATTVAPAELKALEKKLAPYHETLNAAFSLTIKNLEPLSIVTSDRRFDGVGVLRGTMVGNFQDLSLHANLSIDDFFYGNADSGILIQNALTTLDVKNLKPHTPLKDVAAHIVANAGSLHINRNESDSLSITFNYEHEQSSYNARFRHNKVSHFAIEGVSTIIEDYLTFRLNDLQVSFKDFAWRADSGASVAFSPKGIRVAGFTMRRDSQSVSVNGSIMKGESITGSLSGTHLNLDGLRYLLAKDEGDRRRFSGRADIRLDVSGTLESPVYTASLNASGFAFRGVPIGNISSAVQYKDQTLSLSADVIKDPAQPDLTVRGTIPVSLALVPGRVVGNDRTMDLHVQSSGIQIGILDPILPTFDQLDGIMKCDVTVGGTLTHPTYAGTLAIEHCSFIFVPNFVSYTFGGSFSLRGERIYIVNAAVQSKANDDQFKRPGLLQLTGDFSLKDLKPSDFNLTAKGDLLVVRETTRKSSLSVYGNLFIETGPDGLHYTGEIEQSHLSGYVLVKSSSLIFPPTQQNVSEQFSNTVPTVFVNDTVKATTSRTTETALRYFGADGDHARENNNGNGEPSKSFVDGIRYDLEIECAGGNTEFRMIFNSSTNEELVANLNGRFSITEDGKRWVGTLNVDRAYYRFIKQFNADGTIKYSGDFLNPELDITATYEGVRAGADSASTSKPEKVVVTMKISGTRLAPKLEWSMTIDDVDYYSYKGITSSDVQTDAVSFILAGTFPLTRSQANDLASELGPTARSSLVTGATSLFTSAFSDFLRRETGFIYSIELSYGTQASFGEAADIRLSGVAGRGIWKYGGKILNDPLSNANISLMYSLGDILERPSLRNFMVELERKVEINGLGEATDRKQTNSARVFYRFSF